MPPKRLNGAISEQQYSRSWSGLKESRGSSFQDHWKGPTIIREPAAAGRISEYMMVMKNVFWSIRAWAVLFLLGRIWPPDPGK